jgi:carbonic anhydrase
VIQRAEGLPAAAQVALERLLEGNRRFVHNVRSLEPMLGQARRGELVAAQTPFAIVLSCSDSRAPAELIFDQGLGDLFVIRVAGNVIAPSLVGSVEFAAAAFGTPLAMVMGHSRCGAVAATLDAVQGSGGAPTENIGDIVERIRPAVEPLAWSDRPRDELLARCTEANVRRAVEQLRSGSALLKERIRRGQLAVIGAVYSLESGVVSLLGDEG